MTQYHGGKQRIGLEIAERIASISTSFGGGIKGYVEPFSGMLGVYQHIPERLVVDTYLAGDVNKSVIAMWRRAQKGWKPPTSTTEAQYDTLRAQARSSALKGFIGHACSWRGIYFSPFRSRTDLRHSSERVQDIVKKVEKVFFVHSEYNKFAGLKGYVIYCDPPYFKSSRYYDEKGRALKFNHEKFYKWAERMAKNNLVFISENSKLPYNLVATFGEEKLYLI
jgi:site-specific DNA-adenine methylase